MFGQSEQSFRNTFMQRGKDKLEEVEKNLVGLAHLERASNATHTSESTHTGFAKTLMHLELAQQRELKLGHVALIQVRREALRKVLEEERQLYAKELSQKGMAVYQQRI